MAERDARYGKKVFTNSREVVAAHEAFITDGAGEVLLASVCARVPHELVRSRKPLHTTPPAARERLLACGERKVGVRFQPETGTRHIWTEI